MSAVYINSIAYESDIGSERERALLNWESGHGMEVPYEIVLDSLDRRARRELSRAATLAVLAAKRCVADDIPSDIIMRTKARIALFVGCTSGAEIAQPFLEQINTIENTNDSSLVQKIFDNGAVNVLEYLSASVGNIPGQIAKHTGVRGTNACFTGSASSFMALRKAARLIANDYIREGLVVTTEALLGDFPAPREFAAAAYLSTRPSPFRIWLGDADERAKPALGQHFESCSAMLTLAWAIESLRQKSNVMVFVETNRWGNKFHFGLNA